MKITQASNYLDLLVVETLLQDTSLSKFGQAAAPSMMDGIVDKVKGYVSNNVDPNDKAGSVLDMLAPGIISTTFSLMGFGKIGIILGFLARMFHFDLAGIFRSIWSGLKSELSGGHGTTSEKVNDIVQSAVQSNSSAPATTEPTPEASPADDGSTIVARQLRSAKILRLALDNYGQNKIFVYAAPYSKSMLGTILSFIIRVIVSAAGLMVAGDVMNHFLNRPNAIDNKIRDGKPVENSPAASVPEAPQQTRFPPNPSYQNAVKNTAATWVENTTNDPSSIGQMLINFAKEVYQGLEGHEADMQASPYFQNLVETISWYNHEAPGSPSVFIPRMFTTKKQLVDQFVGDVAAKTPATPPKG
jgi:hypothetical protein